MQANNGLFKQVINIDENQFESVALAVFRHQFQNNLVYRRYIDGLKFDPTRIASVKDIPFIPIELFRNQKIVTGSWEPQMTFTSSGTGKQKASKHYIQELEFYEKISEKIFHYFYGPPESYHILALLPSYLERSGSSLVYMLENFINKSNSEFSGFYLHDIDKLIAQVKKINATGDRKLMLWGVSFALLDLSETMDIDLSDAVVIETGGMKGRREEIIREDLHARLKSSFNL